MEWWSESEEKKTIWFFSLRFCLEYDSTYNSDIQFSLQLVVSTDYDSNYNSDSVASEKQPLE